MWNCGNKISSSGITQPPIIVSVLRQILEDNKINEEQEKRIKEIELQYNKSVVTYVKDFDKFYKAEDYHQNYYQTNFINYLLYKKGCGRENRLDQIWKK